MGSPFNIAWTILKASYRGASSNLDTYHLPTELDYNALSSFIGEQDNATLGDLVSPYLQGQFTSPSSDVESTPPSYQETSQNLRQETVDAPFPLSEEDVQQMMSNFTTDEGYNIPRSNIYGKPTVTPEYNQLRNAVKILQGRLRQRPDLVDFNPSRTYKKRGSLESMGGKRKIGITPKSMGERMEAYMNTPVGMAQGSFNIPEEQPPQLPILVQ